MPEDKKNQQKGRNDAKDQRRPRQGRHKAGPVDKNVPLVEKKTEPPKVPQKPVYEEPGPEFYKNLKRETDDILKITEEADSKYKKKEIQSNWSKYEMPIETYEEIEQQESMGADYEQLIQMPLSVGGHFQFKHEKSWDISTAPSLYDKYFDIHMNDLANALCTIPFYERNNIDKAIFSQTDIMTMDNRATRYKQKYYNDKSYTTTELEAQDKIVDLLSKSECDEQNKKEKCFLEKEKVPVEAKIKLEEMPSEKTSINDLKSKETDVGVEITFNTNKIIKDVKSVVPNTEIDIVNKDTEELIKDEYNVESCIQKVLKNEDNVEPCVQKVLKHEDNVEPCIQKVLKNDDNVEQCVQKVEIAAEKQTIQDEVKPPSKPEKSKNPVIESPEDLEKWLDDFLDG